MQFSLGHRPDSGARDAPAWVDLHLLILRYSRQSDDILFAFGRGVRHSRYGFALDRRPGTRRVTTGVRRGGKLRKRRSPVPANHTLCRVALYRDRQRRYKPRPFPLMRVHSPATMTSQCICLRYAVLANFSFSAPRQYTI
jgi:hypothetical protein